ncbi:MAG: Rieske 2Fe-2S domain-containing protein [Candidatus Micrarchaeota archaeon]|nr:Rieske 2Fe-2S domain-containing protein [Candidatus Micrarchaeota archaeon]
MAYYKLDLKKGDLVENEAKPGSANGKKFAVIMKGGQIYVLDGTCTHEGGPLFDGHIDGNELICPWHSGAYFLESGKADENTPWVTDVKRYNCRVDELTGDLEIEM